MAEKAQRDSEGIHFFTASRWLKTYFSKASCWLKAEETSLISGLAIQYSTVLQLVCLPASRDMSHAASRLQFMSLLTAHSFQHFMIRPGAIVFYYVSLSSAVSSL